VNSLTIEWIDSLRERSPSHEILHTVGEPEPKRAAEAFLRAMGCDALAATVELWSPALLYSARPGQGAEHLLRVTNARREAGGEIDPQWVAVLALVLGSSDFLARQLTLHPERLDELGRLSEPPAAPAPKWEAIREAKYRGLLKIAASDLLGHPFQASLRTLSDLADFSLLAALDCTARETGKPAPTLFALGKLGSRELNFSSDVDLIFLYDSPAGEDNLDQNQTAAYFIRHFKKEMELPTHDGFIYRVDLDLRPEGGTGALANSLDAALDYYETFGAEWERQMLIRLRAVGPPTQLTQAFHKGIEPFTYRRNIDPSVFHAVRDMKRRIEEERRAARRDLEVDLKEGPGGIRDIEFFVQAFQLFWGGRIPEVRNGNTLEGLALLSRHELLPDDTASALVDDYLWLRRAEHALQLVEERQTAKFPRDPISQLGLARRMGYSEASGEKARNHLLEDWSLTRTRVRSHFEALMVSND
jgi:glutamate-ammonia-ligase adenylyltransferase